MRDLAVVVVGSRSRVEDVPGLETSAHGCAGDEPHVATRAEAVKGIVFKPVIFPVLRVSAVLSSHHRSRAALGVCDCHPVAAVSRHRGSGPIRTYSGSVGRTVLIMNSLNLSFSSVFGRCAERSNQTSFFRGAFNASKYFAESTEGTS